MMLQIEINIFRINYLAMDVLSEHYTIQFGK